MGEQIGMAIPRVPGQTERLLVDGRRGKAIHPARLCVRGGSDYRLVGGLASCRRQSDGIESSFGTSAVQHRLADIEDTRIGRGLARNLWTDAGWVSFCNRDAWFSH